MFRTAPLLALLCAVGALTGSAFAHGAEGQTHELKGTVAAVSDTAITVKAGADTLTCVAPSTRNYSLATNFHVGDSVDLVCRDTTSGSVVAELHRLGATDKPQPSSAVIPPPATTITGDHPSGDHPSGDHPSGDKPNPPSNHPSGDSKSGDPNSRLQGTISAVSDTSVTVSDTAGASLTCAMPSVRNYSLAAHFHTGDSVDLTCRKTTNGTVLAALHRLGTNEHPNTGPPSSTDKSSPGKPLAVSQTLQGTISTMSDSSITVGDGSNVLTCTVPIIRSYSLSAHFHTGDHVRLVCRAASNGLTLAELHRVGGNHK